MVLCWLAHQAQLQRGILSTGTGDSLWLGRMAEFFTSETTFWWSEPLFPPPFPQSWQKQGGDCPSYGHFCLKVPEELPPSFPSAQVSVPVIGWLLVWHPQHPMRTWCFIHRENILDCIIPGEVRLKSMGCCSWQSPWNEQQSVDPPAALRGFPSCPSHSPVPIKRKYCQKENWELQVFRYLVAKHREERDGKTWDISGTSIQTMCLPHWLWRIWIIIWVCNMSILSRKLKKIAMVIRSFQFMNYAL